ncbi:hypothetical protein HMI54_005793 [Coelomomyces lativittatus]|nr:hypothetical protein HMI56_004430 [Coelomomyces lativittatus]KAJ1517388.1 hypothetical protein HMI54_005793 [Coelomomyces lativittatus]
MMNTLIRLTVIYLVIVQTLTFDSRIKDREFKLKFISGPENNDEALGPQESSRGSPFYEFIGHNDLFFGPLQLHFKGIYNTQCESISVLLSFFASSLDYKPTSGQQPEDNFMLGMEKTKETLIPLFQSAEVQPFLFEALLNDETQQFISQHRKALKEYLDTKKAILDKIIIFDSCHCDEVRCWFNTETPEHKKWSYTDILIHNLKRQMEAESTYWSSVQNELNLSDDPSPSPPTPPNVVEEHSDNIEIKDREFKLKFISGPENKVELLGPQESSSGSPSYEFIGHNELFFGPLQLHFKGIYNTQCDSISILLSFFASSLDYKPTSGQQPEDNFVLGMEKTKETLVPLFQSAKVQPFLFEALLNDETQQFISQHRKALKQYLDTKKTILDKIFITKGCFCDELRCWFTTENPDFKKWSYTDILIHNLKKQMQTHPTYWSFFDLQSCQSPDDDLCEVEKMKAAQRHFPFDNASTIPRRKR